ncbi:MAG: hypothetical protein GEU73_10140, partial [Chloroflexi bacterium]|nr:hypothetical protein [Chloroflexota bacterium]
EADAAALRATSADRKLAEARLAAERARRDARDAEGSFTYVQRALDSLIGEARALDASLAAHSALSAQPSSLLTRFRVPGRYERALATALGPAARYHVVDAAPTAWFADPEHPDSRSPGSDRRGAAQHDDRRTPWVLVPESRPSLDSELIAFRRWVDGLLRGSVTYELAVDILEAPDDADLAGRYLGTTIIVDTLKDARQAARALTARGTSELPFQVATLDGQCLRSNGERVFGPDPADAQVIEVRARRSCVADEIVEAEDRAKQAETRLAGARGSEAEVLAALADREAEVQRAFVAASAAAERLAMLQGELRRDDEQLRHLAAAHATASDPEQIRVIADQQARLRAEMAPIEEVLRSHTADLKAAEEERARAEEEHRASTLEQARVDAQLAWLREIVERDQREIDRLTETERALREKEALLERDLRTLAERGASLDQHLRAAEAQAEGLAVQASAAESAIADVDASAAVLERERRDAQSALADLRADEARVGGDHEHVQGMLDRLDVEMRSIAESLAVRPVDLVGHDRSGAHDPQAQVEFQHEPTDSAADALHRRLVRAQRAFRDVGHVDSSVLAEHAALRDRYQHMATQLDDLARTESAIRARMSELRERMQTQFMATFGEVSTRFREQFRHLFRGGDAELMLSGEPESPQCGIDIVAQPPGKRLHRLAALSGGERALAGAALLLALIGAKPSPFCMLDEVDAALDEANVHRFVATVREMAQLTQFILVTHNRTTIEMANALYGVTMTPGAVSQVVAITLPN